MRKPEVTILIVTYNALPYLKVTINSIKKNTDIPYKIIVIDNGSSISTTKYLIQNSIPFLRNPINIGYIEAQTLGFKLIDTQYICSCNDDIVVTKGWLKSLLNKLKQNPKVKIISPVKYGTKSIHPYTKKSSREIWNSVKAVNRLNNPLHLLNFFTYGKSLERFAKDFIATNNYGDRILECPPEFVAGFCILTETEIWKKIGGFVDLDMSLYGTEDVERCWRVASKGYKVMRTDTVYVHHFEGISVKKNNIKTDKVIVKNNRILIDKIGGVFWEWLRKVLKYKPLDSVIKDYWIVLELLHNSRKSQIPADILKHWRKYEKTYK